MTDPTNCFQWQPITTVMLPNRFIQILAIDPTTGDLVCADNTFSSESPRVGVRRLSSSGVELSSFILPDGIEGGWITGLTVDENGDIWGNELTAGTQYFPGDELGSPTGPPYPLVYRLSGNGALEEGFFPYQPPSASVTVYEPEGLFYRNGKIYFCSTALGYPVPPYSSAYGLRISLTGTIEQQYGFVVYPENNNSIDYEPPLGGLIIPGPIAVDHTGCVYISDVWRYTITKYSPDGTPLFRFGGVGTAPGKFYDRYPDNEFVDGDVWFQETGFQIGIDSQNRVFVTDLWAGRVNYYDSNGNYLGSFGQGVLQRPQGIVVADDDTIWVADFNGVYNPETEVWDQPLTRWDYVDTCQPNQNEFSIRAITSDTCAVEGTFADLTCDQVVPDGYLDGYGRCVEPPRLEFSADCICNESVLIEFTAETYVSDYWVLDVTADSVVM